MKHHKIHKLNESPNYDYLGHPINAYHLIRHVASGWSNILENVMNDDVFGVIEDLSKYPFLQVILISFDPILYLSHLDMCYNCTNVSLSELLKDRTTDQKLPTMDDIDGGAHGIVRLYSQYR